MMLQILAQFPIGFFIALSGVLIPGPLLAYLVAKSSTHGALTGLFTAAGHILVELVLLFLLMIGLGMILQSQFFQVIIGLVGGILLTILGLLSVVKLIQNPVARETVVSKYHPVVGGILFSTVLNPSVILWWTTIGLATLMEAYLVASLGGVVFWLLGHFTADLSWFSLVSFSVSRGRKFLGTGVYRAILLTCGFVLLILGIYFIGKYVPPFFHLM